jgi:hypothetical protein
MICGWRINKGLFLLSLLLLLIPSLPNAGSANQRGTHYRYLNFDMARIDDELL